MRRKRIIPEQREAEHIALFIDMDNIYHAQKDFFGDTKRVCFRSMIDSIADRNNNRHVLMAKAFLALHPDHGDAKKKFITSLERMNIQVISKTCLVDKNGHALKGKSNMDVEIAIHAMEALYMPQIQTIVLVSGDGDFSAIGDYTKSFKKKFEVMGFQGSISHSLTERADKVTYINNPQFLIPRKKAA